MAGSFQHVVTKKGKLRPPGANHLDHLGDGNEAIEEMYGMIWYLATSLDGVSGKTSEEWVKEAQKNYREGLERSPGVQVSDD